jgi:anti-anti-sigma regulatory factor
MRRLRTPLARLAGKVRRGDVVIDLSRVHVLNLESLRLLSSLERRMRRQRRQLVLCGVRDDCGGVGHISGLGIVCYPTQVEAVECLLSRARV